MLPTIVDDAAFGRMHKDHALWLPAAEAIAARHGFHEQLVRMERGSALVFAQHERVLKLFPPHNQISFEREHAVLARLADQLSLPTPRLLAQGELEGWPYLWMTRLAGQPLDDCWPRLTPTLRQDMAHQAGVATRELHRLSYADLPHLSDDWPGFRQQMRVRCAAYNRARGLTEPWLRQLPHYLEALDDEPEPGLPAVLLHTELGPGHLLTNAGRLSGLLDFADAAVGDPEYDLAAIGIFVTRGDRAAFRAFLDGYEMPVERRGPTLIRRLMRHALLHRYGHLAFYLAECPPPEATLTAAAGYWFGHLH